MPYFVFKFFWDILAPPYLHVWNRSLCDGTFPVPYKKANLIPLPKTKEATTSDEIRGISITSISARLFERCVHKKWIQPSIELTGDTYQFAYKSRLSTLDCLITIQHYIISLLDLPSVDGVHLIMLDFSKAFDRINQELAATCFPKFIQSPYICQWLYDFIIQRYQRLIWKGKALPYMPIDLGCSQGTVGGPSVYSMFSDDIRAQNPSSLAFKYSDDTSVLVPCYSSPSLLDVSNLQLEIRNTKCVAEKKQLKINKNKSKMMRFSLNPQPTCPCKVENTYEEVCTHEILGVHFDRNCRFSTHSKQLIKRLKRTIYILRDSKLNDLPQSDIE